MGQTRVRIGECVKTCAAVGRLGNGREGGTAELCVHALEGEIRYVRLGKGKPKAQRPS